MESNSQGVSPLVGVLSPWLQRFLVLVVWVSAGLAAGHLASTKKPLTGWSPAGKVSINAQSRSSAMRILPQRPSRTSKPMSEVDLLRHRLAYQGISDLKRWGIKNDRAKNEEAEDDRQRDSPPEGFKSREAQGSKANKPAQQGGSGGKVWRIAQDHKTRSSA